MLFLIGTVLLLEFNPNGARVGKRLGVGVVVSFGVRPMILMRISSELKAVFVVLHLPRASGRIFGLTEVEVAGELGGLRLPQKGGSGVFVNAASC